MLGELIAHFLKFMAGPHDRIGTEGIRALPATLQHNGSSGSQIAFLLVNHLTLQHALQGLIFDRNCLIHAGDRVIPRRSPHQSGQGGAFHQVELFYFLAEIMPRRRFDAVAILSVENAAEVLLQNGVFIEAALNALGEHHFQQLAVHGFAAQFIHIAGKLHGDGGCPLLITHGLQVTQRRAQYRGEHHPAVFKEILVLPRHKGIHQVPGQLVSRHEA